jgi:hypothetical protein
MITALLLWTITFANFAKSARFLANITRFSSQEFACDYASQLSFQITIPSDVSPSMFGKPLTLSLGLPQGTTFLSTNIKVFWTDMQAPLLSLGDSDFPYIQAKIQLSSTIFQYSLTIIHTKGIIHAFSQGEKPITISIYPLDMSNQILGQSSIVLEYRPGSLLLISPRRSSILDSYHKLSHRHRYNLQSALRLLATTEQSHTTIDREELQATRNYPS